MRLYLPYLMVLLTITGSTYCQTVSLRGKVTDDKNLPIGGVSILVKGTRVGTTTNEEGLFTLNTSGGKKIILVASFTGYAGKEIEVAGSGDIQFVLSTTSSTLTDVIVVSPLGLTRKAKSVPYSSQSVDPTRLTEARDVNIVNGLAGKVAGIQVTTTGQPGSSSRVILRGDNSITGNSQPLWVVDGVPIADNTGNPTNGGLTNNLDVGQGAADLNPDDIESIEVLKGPNAAALYGSQAANGAILITTKKAKFGDKTLGIALNQNTMFNTITEFPAVQNEWGEGDNGKLVNGQNANIIPGTGAVNMGNNASSWGAPMLGQPFNTYSGKPHGYTPQPGNITSLYKTSVTNASNVSISKSDPLSAFRLSYTFTNNNDVMQKQNMGIRHNLNLTASRKLGNLLNIDARLLYTNQDWKNRTTRNPANDGSSPMAYYIYVPRSTDPSSLNPYKDANGNAFQYGVQSDGYDNIFWNINENRNEDKRQRFIGGMTATLNLTHALKFRAQVSGDLLFYSQYQYKEPGGRQTKTGFYFQDSRTDQNWNYEGLFMYNTKFGHDLTLNANAGTNLAINNSLDRTATINSLLVHEMPSISNTNSAQVAGESLVRSERQSVYGTATVGFRDLLFVDLTGRNDWSSTLPAANNSYFYSSVGGSFVFSQLLTSRGLISYGKVRASWAKVGNSANPYQLTNTFSYGGLFLGNPYLNYTNTSKNPTLKPEQVVSKEIGLDLNLFKNRISLTATAYETQSTNQILNAQTPFETGFNARIVNAGEMSNKGIELSLNATAIQSKKFSWNILANWSTNKNKVLSMVPGVNRLQFGQTLGIYNNAIVGQPFGVFTGSIPYRSHDTILMNSVKNGRILQDNSPLPIVGSPRPDWIGSAGSTFRYGGFDFSFLVTAKVGGKFYSGTTARMGFYGTSLASLDGRDAYFLSSFILGENDNERLNIGQQVGSKATRYGDSTRVKGKQWYSNAYYPKVDPATGQAVLDKNGRFVPGEKASGWFNPHSIAADNVTGNVELNLFDATSVKLSEMVLGYSIPPHALNKTFIKTARVAFVGRNLWTIFKNTPRGIDPDAALNSGTTGYGVEAGGSFPYATYGFDLKVSF